MSNADVIRDIYTAFGRGDIQAIVDQMAPDVQWEYGLSSTTVPWLQPRRGRDGVAAFFQAFGGAAEVHRFAVNRILDSGDLVLALIDVEFTVRATGRRVVEQDEVHIWWFSDGQISRFRHRADTAQHQIAFALPEVPAAGETV